MAQTPRRLMSTQAVYVGLLVAVATLSVAVAILAVRPPTVVTNTQVITQTQDYSFTDTTTMAYTVMQPTTVTSVQFTQSQYDGYVPQTGWYNPAACGYPFNPYFCNEGPPVTVIGYLSNSTGCIFLDGGIQGSGNANYNQNYVVWDLPNRTFPAGSYRVYGFIYPDWPQSVIFPPYPFAQSKCIGTPLWAIAPYIQTA